MIHPDSAEVAVNHSANAEALGRIAETVFNKNDLTPLSPGDRVLYVKALCQHLGLNYLTKPFDFIQTENGIAMYPNKECAAQLSSKYGITKEVVSREVRDDVLVVTVRAKLPDGRADESIGAVAMVKEQGEWKTAQSGKKYFQGNGVYKPLPPEARANAWMRAECVPLHSEILTRSGWRTYDQVSPGDEVLAYDCATDSCQWTALLDVTIYDSAPVVRLHSQNFDVLCTPDHSWAVQQPGYVPRSDGSRKLRGPYANRGPARELLKACYLNTGHRIILAAQEYGTSESVLTPAEAAIMGWAITDGTIQQRASHRRIGICQSKEENFDAIREVVSAVAGPVHEQVTVTGSRTFPGGRTYDTRPQRWWYLPAKISKALLKKAGFEDGGPQSMPNLAARLSPLARKAMLQAMLLADADQRNVFAKSKRYVLDTLQMLCVLEGKALGIERDRKVVITQRVKKTRHIAASFLQREDAGTMPVWCPTTAFGTWVMRQNGLVTITGNTKAKRRSVFALVGLGMPDSPDDDGARWDYDVTTTAAIEAGTAGANEAGQTQQQQAVPEEPPPPSDPELDRQIQNFVGATREQRIQMFAQLKADLEKQHGNEGIAFYYDVLKECGAREAHDLKSWDAAKKAFGALWSRLREGVSVSGEEPVV